jgi:hypothetical protein
MLAPRGMRSHVSAHSKHTPLQTQFIHALRHHARIATCKPLITACPLAQVATGGATLTADKSGGHDATHADFDPQTVRLNPHGHTHTHTHTHTMHPPSSTMHDRSPHAFHCCTHAPLQCTCAPQLAWHASANKLDVTATPARVCTLSLLHGFFSCAHQCATICAAASVGVWHMHAWDPTIVPPTRACKQASGMASTHGEDALTRLLSGQRV